MTAMQLAFQAAMISKPSRQANLAAPIAQEAITMDAKKGTKNVEATKTRERADPSCHYRR
jgi:hypothetical protein